MKPTTLAAALALAAGAAMPMSPSIPPVPAA